MALQYAHIVRFIRSAILVVGLVGNHGWTSWARAQQTPPPTAPQQQPAPPAPAPVPPQPPPVKDQMFSGSVTAVAESSLTVARQGSGEVKVFVITPDTRFEGPRPQLNSRVTIRYIAAEDGDRAVRVIVRSPEKK